MIQNVMLSIGDRLGVASCSAAWASDLGTAAYLQATQMSAMCRDMGAKKRTIWDMIEIVMLPRGNRLGVTSCSAAWASDQGTATYTARDLLLRVVCQRVADSSCLRCLDVQPGHGGH